MYDGLYSRLGEFEEREGVEVEAAETLPHPHLNERIEEEFASGRASYDLISTHTKYAPTQSDWLTPLLYYRTDLMQGPPSTWEELLEEGARLRSEDLYGFAFPGKESGLFGHFFELHAMAGGTMFADTNTPAPNLDDEAGRWALSLLKDLRERAAPEKTTEWHYEEVAACFREGRDVDRLARGLLHLRGSRAERGGGSLRRCLLPGRTGRTLRVLELAHLRHTLHGTRSPRSCSPAALPHLEAIPDDRGEAGHPPREGGLPR
jgi:hypothetical protein